MMIPFAIFICIFLLFLLLFGQMLLLLQILVAMPLRVPILNRRGRVSVVKLCPELTFQ